MPEKSYDWIHTSLVSKYLKSTCRLLLIVFKQNCVNDIPTEVVGLKEKSAKVHLEPDMSNTENFRHD